MTEIQDHSLLVKKWVRICLLNLLVVVILGTTMRYKIAFALPWLPQKNVLNAHSHFAFAGWLSQILMTLMVRYLAVADPTVRLRKYNGLLWFNLIAAWGMLFSFSFSGYGIASIAFSTLTVFAAYSFTVVFWRDLNHLPNRHISHLWFKAALIWNVISSAGPFFLAYMTANGIDHQHWYLGSIYFYLHFQYNGWFFFAGVGLLFSRNLSCTRREQLIFWLIALACGPAYMLSILWAHLPIGAYSLTVIATLAQTLGWLLVLVAARKGRIVLLHSLRPTIRVLMIFAAVSGTIKFILQAGSLHPGLAKLAFGFRPIVIGYLHLVLLGLITLFLIAYLKHLDIVAPGGFRKAGIVTFIAGIVLQELLLFVQGVMALDYLTVPFINESLFVSAIVMLTGVFMLNLGMARQGNYAPAST